MGKFWVSADLHLCHKNVIVHDQRPFWTPGAHSGCPGYPEGMVPDIQAHDTRIIEIINETVKPGDEFWCLGDFRFIGGTRKEWRVSAEEYLKRIRP